jgi:4a-hydroxytetrahydrobiopterin dehydratase
MTTLYEENCQRNSNQKDRLNQEKIEKLQQQTSEWELIQEDDVKHLIRTFKFNNFIEALAFTNQVGKISEEQGHHPLIHLTWGRVTVEWWTHDLKGLGKNDFIMAAKTDKLYESNK